MKLSTFFLVLCATAFLACSNSQVASHSNSSTFQLTTLKGKLAEPSDLSGTIFVYDNLGESVANHALSFAEDENGDRVVVAPIIRLKRSQSYRFIVIFTWKNTPIAYVDITRATENADTTSISFDESQIQYGPSPATNFSLSESEQEDISAGILPNLDTDNDGYNNLDEFLAGTDPNNSSDIPQGPKITSFDVTVNPQSTLLTISAVFQTGHGIRSVVTTFKDHEHLKHVLSETLTSDDEQKVWTYQATLNPQYASSNSLVVQIYAVDDRFGFAGNEQSKTINFTLDPSINLGPIIRIVSPQPGETVTGDRFDVSIIAYDERNGVTDIEILSPLGATVNNYSQISSIESSLNASFSSVNVGNGNKTLTVQAVDGSGITSTKSQSFIVDRELVTGAPRLFVGYDTQTQNNLDIGVNDVVRGIIRLRVFADVVDGRRVVSLIFDNENDFITEEVDGFYDFWLDTTSFANETILLNFSVRDDSSLVTRQSFSLNVQNKPHFNLFKITGTNSLGQTVSGEDSTIVKINPSTNPVFNWDVNNVTKLILKDPEGQAIDTATSSTVSSITGTANPRLTKSGTYTLSGEHAVGIWGGGFNEVEQNIFTTNATLNIELHSDTDTLKDEDDNCDQIENEDQLDTDGDSEGDACDTDDDNDGVLDATDNCPLVANSDQENNDGDAFGYVCDADDDGDGFCDMSKPGPLDAGSRNCTVDPADCDDSDPQTYVGASEFIDGTDQDCDGSVYDIPLELASATFSGEGANTQLGFSVANAGDVNGDGIDDIIMGAPGANNSTGAVALFYGNEAITVGDLLASEADVIFRGERNGDEAGFSVAGAGDVNGDGCADIVVGAPGVDTQSGINVGKVYLIYGRSDAGGCYPGTLRGVIGLDTIGTDAFDKEGATFLGEGANARAGHSVASAGHFADSRYSSIIISALGGTGKGYVIYGGIAADTETQRRNLLLGDKNLSALTTAYYGTILACAISPGACGTKVAGGMDLNNDGWDDVMITSPLNDGAATDAGKVRFFLGGQRINDATGSSDGDWRYFGGAPLVYAGAGMDMIGDFNGDGKNDVAIGSYGFSSFDGTQTSAGKTSVFYGGAGGQAFPGASTGFATALAPNLNYFGEGATHDSGKYISRVGDADGDGLDDLLIASYNANEGRVYLVYGDNGVGDYLLGSLPLQNEADDPVIHTFIGEARGDFAGIGLAGGDFNGDGKADVLIGAPNNDDGGADAGKVYLILSGY